MPSQYKIITKPEEVDQLIQHCKTTGYASVDFETNAMKVVHPLFLPTILGVSFQPGSCWIIPLAHFDSPFYTFTKGGDNIWEEVLKKFGREVIENKAIVKIAQNAKFEYQIFRRYGIEMMGRVFDNMLAKYLLDEEKPMGLKPMVDRFIPEYAGYSEDYEGSNLPWDEKPLKGLSQYCGLDTDLTFRMMLTFEPKLIATGLYPLFRNMMMMGVRVLGDSEYGGMPIDEEYLADLVLKYQGKIADSLAALRLNKKIRKFEKWQQKDRTQKLISKVSEDINKIYDEIEDFEHDIKKLKKKNKKKPNEILEKEIKKMQTAIGRKEKSVQTREDKIDRYQAKQFNTKSELAVLDPVNFSSPAQMIDLFFRSRKGFNFKVVKYTTDKKTKQETDRPSTDEEVLLALAEIDKSGFCKELLEYRGLTKLYSTYVIGIQDKVVEGRVHGRFLLEGTVTGRLSSRDPNLQNIPRDTTASDIKTMFVPPPGYLLVQLDYSQAELRVMAAMAKEETMIKWFQDGKDIHLSSALKKYKCEERYDEIKEVLDLEDKNDPRFKEWKMRRKNAKTINFGIIYGQGPGKLAGTLECTIDEAKKFLSDFFKEFPKVKKFIDRQHKAAHRNAYVRNVFKRKRRLPDIDSPKHNLVAQAERQSVNAPIQGAASDYTLFSSIIIWEEVRKGNIKIDLPQCYTVHDSLGFFIKPEVIHEVIPKLQKICENPSTQEWFGFEIEGVTMAVDFEIAHDNWGNLKTYREDMDYTQFF